MKRKNVAIFPSGTEIGLEINNALKFAKDINVIGLSSASDHTRFVFDQYVDNLPFYKQENFIEELNKIIEEFKIDYLYPAHDDVLLFLSQHKEEIKAIIVASDTETVQICRSKIDTYRYFENEKFVPKIYDTVEKVAVYPVFIKPDIGQGSQGAKLIQNKMELEFEYQQNQDIVICEYLIGEEYTVDCFTDIEGKLKVISPRNRKRIKSGISVNSEDVPLTEEIEKIAIKINEKLSFNGAWFFQLKQDNNNEMKLLEIAARIPGTMGLSRNLGINFPLLTIYNMMHLKTEVMSKNYHIELDRAFINRYKIEIEYDTVYIDFDDTIIINHKVNSYMMMFLYQLVNENKKVILITKHANELEKSLEQYKICTRIFDKIIHLSEKEEKSNYIESKKSIFIDDSFIERKKVYDKKGIPVFDLDSVESLINWKVGNYHEEQ